MYGLYVCTCEFLRHRESFDVILINARHFTMGSYNWQRQASASNRQETDHQA
jgi:hypothetical protein